MQNRYITIANDPFGFFAELFEIYPVNDSSHTVSTPATKHGIHFIITFDTFAFLAIAMAVITTAYGSSLSASM